MKRTFKKRRFQLRSLLVTFQFFLSSVFISQTLFLNHQVNFIKNKDIGFHKQDVVVLPILDDAIRNSLKAAKYEFARNPDILNVAAASALPGLGIPRDVKVPEGYSSNDMQLMDDIHVDADFLPALNITLVSGRNFSEMNPTDRNKAVIVNQLAAKKFGWKDPIGKTIRYSVGENKFETGTVIGVVKDFHLSSLHRVIEPLFIGNQTDRLNYILVRIQPERKTEALQYIQNTWQTLFPNHPFEYSFLADSYDFYYRNVSKTQEFLGFFSLLAILLACLGIFALATFTVERKTKEIGIRKVLGDSTIRIIARLNAEILRTVGIAILCVVPLVIYEGDFMDQFFPYKTDMSIFIYFEAVILVYVFAILSISYQAIRAATANPVEALRYE
jgi:putative ABC transport system permease protein